jgi:hypothetical protein
VTAFREQHGNGGSNPLSIPEVLVPDIDALEEHALNIARYSEMISTTLGTLTGTTAGTSGTHGGTQAPVEGSRRADAQLFAQMSTHFFDR